VIHRQFACEPCTVRESRSFLCVYCYSVSVPADSLAPSGDSPGPCFCQVQNLFFLVGFLSFDLWTVRALTVTVRRCRSSPVQNCFSQSIFGILTGGQSEPLSQIVWPLSRGQSAVSARSVRAYASCAIFFHLFVCLFLWVLDCFVVPLGDH
jgi:hypothetical protein